MRNLCLVGIGLLALALALPFERAGAQQEPGVLVQHVEASARRPLPYGDGIITLVRVDMRRYRLRFLTEARHGPRRSAEEWMRTEGLGGVTNAGMFLPNGRSVGHMVQDGAVVSRRIVSRYRGLLGFAPLANGASFMSIGGGPRGRGGCPQTLASFKREYANVLQAYPLLDCRGRAVSWRNNMRYSAAGLGVDSAGRAVFMHTRTPYRMEVLSRMLAAPELGLRGMIYLEGGPEATLLVRSEGESVRAIGSYEDGFNENDDNQAMWDLPNVIAFQRR